MVRNEGSSISQTLWSLCQNDRLMKNFPANRNMTPAFQLPLYIHLVSTASCVACLVAALKLQVMLLRRKLAVH
jgi:hypothetical protein